MKNAKPEHDEVLTTKEVADILKVTEWCVRNWRHLGTKGPKYYKDGPRFIRYRRSAVDAYLASVEQSPTDTSR